MKDLDVAVVEDPMLSHLLHAVSAQSMLCKSCDMHHIIMEFEELVFFRMNINTKIPRC